MSLGEAHKAMKPTPKSKKFQRFTAAMQTIMTVSKAEIVEREKQYQAERSTHKKRGPKPNSDHSKKSQPESN